MDLGLDFICTSTSIKGWNIFYLMWKDSNYFFFFKENDSREYFFPLTITQTETLMKGQKDADRRNAANLCTLMVYKLQAETKYKTNEFLSKSVDFGKLPDSFL